MARLLIPIKSPSRSARLLDLGQMNIVSGFIVPDA